VSSQLKWLEKELTLWVEKGWIAPDAARKLVEYYRVQKSGGPSRLLVIFSILGGLLISLGVILLFAHNWDDLTNHIRAGICLGLVLLTQAIATYALVRKASSISWMNTSAVANFLAIGAAIALISQTYHMPGSMEGFLKVWLLLGLPILYVFQSSLSGVLYYVLLVSWALEWGSGGGGGLILWGLSLGPAPYLIMLFRRGTRNASDSLFVWAFGLATPLALAVGVSGADHATLQIALGLAGLFGLFYSIGSKADTRGASFSNLPLRLLGGGGLIGMGLAMSFKGAWQDSVYIFENTTALSLLLIGLLLSVLIAGRGIHYLRVGPLHRGFVHLFPVFLLFLVILGQKDSLHTICAILSSLYILILGVCATYAGGQENDLGQANLGMLCIFAVVSVRFADDDLSFIARGVGFIILGALFLCANIYLLRAQKGLSS